MLVCFEVVPRGRRRWTYRLEGAGVLGPPGPPRHCTLTVNPSDRNSTGSLVGTSWGGGGVAGGSGDRGAAGRRRDGPCHRAGASPGHLQHTPRHAQKHITRAPNSCRCKCFSVFFPQRLLEKGVFDNERKVIGQENKKK